MKDNIILIGFMGCGKTTIGNELYKRLNYKFLDTDAEIEKNSGMTISDIFAKHGEEYFRNLETKTIEDMINNVNETIISTGGGLPLRKCNAEILKKLGIVVYLKVKKDTVLKRLEGDNTRPLLAGDNVDEKVEKLLEFRNPIYEKSAHLIIETDDKTIEDILEEIIKYQLIKER